MQAATLCVIVQNGFLDDVPVDKIKDFQGKLVGFSGSRAIDLMAKILKEKALSDALIAELKAGRDGIQADLLRNWDAQHARHTPPHPVGQEHGANHQGHGIGRGREDAQGAAGGAGRASASTRP